MMKTTLKQQFAQQQVFPLGAITVDADATIPASESSSGRPQRSLGDAFGALAAVGLVVGGFILVRRATS